MRRKAHLYRDVQSTLSSIYCYKHATGSGGKSTRALYVQLCNAKLCKLTS